MKSLDDDSTSSDDDLKRKKDEKHSKEKRKEKKEDKKRRRKERKQEKKAKKMHKGGKSRKRSRDDPSCGATEAELEMARKMWGDSRIAAKAAHVCVEASSTSCNIDSEHRRRRGGSSSTSVEKMPVRVPMTREQYEAEQSVVREVLDPTTNRIRLIKGTGEVIERIVSRSEHAAINALATRGDGCRFFAETLAAARR